jgi:HEPN domain-containing protein
MNQSDLAADLLALAREDLASAEALVAADGVSAAPVGFHAQQAVEKSLKAAIALAGGEFPFTHNLGLLMRLSEDCGLEPPSQLAQADRLTPYAATVRYGLGDPGTVDPGDALRWAALAIEWAEARPGSSDPT